MTTRNSRDECRPLCHHQGRDLDSNVRDNPPLCVYIAHRGAVPPSANYLYVMVERIYTPNIAAYEPAIRIFRIPLLHTAETAAGYRSCIPAFTFHRLRQCRCTRSAADNGADVQEEEAESEL